MAELKTKPNDASVEEFINGISDETKQEDSRILVKIFSEITGDEPKMWGPSIIGFGTYHYKYASGREGDWMRTGFSPRKQSLTLYIMDGFDKYDELLSQLGKHKTGKSCLYVNRLSDVDGEVLRELIEASVEHFNNKYGE
ncbi:MAG: DUF1801 domain-containing protein [Acidobacteria bacterium]|nr:MAG: DUF1801 domain-containing protein [Acidobacteriota bacterium]REK01953.1 MAG: DUF1801 domain-containing protein [Acidobacteriota bacterium]REK14909.1 MAG: DUF1801 domain-containing protein [Acidobacteriota bacterium]REK45624.1 MAG: DUF1801 domain-containing protein [Acidobacteriota bacterium]